MPQSESDLRDQELIANLTDVKLRLVGCQVAILNAIDSIASKEKLEKPDLGGELMVRVDVRAKLKVIDLLIDDLDKQIQEFITLKLKNVIGESDVPH